MGRAGLALFFLIASPAVHAADKPDPLAEARQLYNQRQFDAALTAAERARLTPAVADRADLIAARAYLERFRESAASDDLTNARDRLRRVDPQRFDALERTEFIVGLGEALYFDGSYGAAADVFETVVDNGAALPADSRDRVLDWWAIAVDRDAWLRPEPGRESAYQRIRGPHARRVDVAPGQFDGGVLAGGGRPRAGRSSGGVGRGGGGLGAREPCDRPRRGASCRSRSADARRDHSRARENARAAGGEPQTRLGKVQGAVGGTDSLTAPARKTRTVTSSWTHVTLRVLRRVHDEPQLCRRQLVPADGARLGERPLVGGAKRVDRAIDFPSKRLDEILRR